MNILLNIVERDDLEAFKNHFNLDNWQDTVTKIENYAGVSKYTPQKTYDNCDIFKYSLHCNADSIFNYLLPLVDTDKHGENYGWPLLAMALKNQRYDYAYSIVDHKDFNPYPMYHNNVLTHIDSRENPSKHLEFAFHFLNKFDKWDFKNKSNAYLFSHILCYNELSYFRFERLYRNKMKNENAFPLDIYTETENLDILAREVIYNNFKPFILDKINSEQFTNMLDSIMSDKTIFAPLFEGQDAQKGLDYLIQYPEMLQKYIDENKVIVSYLPLSCIVFLMENNIDIWREDEGNISAIDYILEPNNLEDPKTLFFMGNYTERIFNKYKDTDRKTKIKEYCQNKLKMRKSNTPS